MLKFLPAVGIIILAMSISESYSYRAHMPSYIEDAELVPLVKAIGSFDESRAFRDTRSVQYPKFFPSFAPTRPWLQIDRQLPPIYARSTRDVHMPGMKKPTYHDVVIPNWNPYIKTDPRQILGIKQRNKRGL